MQSKQALILSSLVFVLGASIAAAQNVTYKYDDLGRVVNATQAGQSTTYSYDNADNRTAVITGTGSSSSSSSSSSATNHAPSCPSFTINFNPPTNYPQNLQIPYGSGCTDPDGDTVTTNPTPTTVTIYIHTTTYYPFTASDGHGGSTSGTITVVRN